jgi:endo-1,4-beta-xylanase
MGEMDNPPTYYFVVEDAVPSTQDFGTQIGSVDCDGASYKVTHYSAVYGGVTYEKYYSVRTQPKFHRGQVKGTISVGCHWDVWTRLGMKVGDQKEQFMLIEGAATKSPRAKDLGGSASITVSEGSSS